MLYQEKSSFYEDPSVGQSPRIRTPGYQVIQVKEPELIKIQPEGEQFTKGVIERMVDVHYRHEVYEKRWRTGSDDTIDSMKSLIAIASSDAELNADRQERQYLKQYTQKKVPSFIHPKWPTRSYDYLMTPMTIRQIEAVQNELKKVEDMCLPEGAQRILQEAEFNDRIDINLDEVPEDVPTDEDDSETDSNDGIAAYPGWSGSYFPASKSPMGSATQGIACY